MARVRAAKQIIFLFIFLFLSFIPVWIYAVNPRYIYAPETQSSSTRERIHLEITLGSLLKQNQTVFDARSKEWAGVVFLVDKSILATVNHLVPKNDKLEVLINSSRQPLDLFGRLQTKDIAFLRFADQNMKIEAKIPSFKSARIVFEELAKEKNVPLHKVLVGMKCFGIDSSPSIIIGELWHYNQYERNFDFTAGGDVRGCSGAPVFNFDGKIIGMAYGATKDWTRARDIAEIQEALEVFKNKNNK